MNKKVLNCVLLFLAIGVWNSLPAFSSHSLPQKDGNISVSVKADSELEEYDVIKRVCFRDKLRKSPQTQINNFFKKYNSYAVKNDMEKLKSMYTDDYVNNDGFDKKTIFKMMELSADSYQNITYTTDILSIDVDGDYAIVKLHEVIDGETSKPVGNIQGNGTIYSDMYYTDYLRKENNKWKIAVSNVEYEKVDLKYGEAKKAVIDITAPQYVSAGSSYEVSIKTKTPDGVFIVGSIDNDEIIYPQKSKEDVFRTIKSEELARILKANTSNNNEYATASVALTRVNVEPPSVVLSMCGIAFTMKRVNVIPINKNVTFAKEIKNGTNTAK